MILDTTNRENHPREFLPNGARIMRLYTDDTGVHIVLADWNKNPAGRPDYVTWKVADDMSTFSGHYHGDDLVGAIEDFMARIA